jgi:hypothetical protein
MPGVRADTGYALLILGSTALVQEQFDRAASWIEPSLELFQEVGNDWGVGEAQAALGSVSYCTGDFASAAARYAASLDRPRTIRHPLMVGTSLYGLAGIAAESGWPEKGARLLGAAEGLASSLGAPAYPRDQPVRARSLVALTKALGQERLEAAREAGRALTIDQAVAEANVVAEAVAGTSS